MRVLVLTTEARVPDLSAVYQSLARYLDIDLHVHAKSQQRQLRPQHWVLCNDAEAAQWLAGSGTN